MRRALVALLLLGACFDVSRADELLKHGAVAADHEAASRAGAEVLAQGGNAVDAAVATALALGVVRPDSSGLGGGGFMVYRRAKDGRVFALDFREKAPRAAHRDMYLKDGKVVPGLSEDGGLAVAVPGEAAGLSRAHRQHGRLPWRAVVEPARALAADGVVVTPAWHEEVAGDADMVRKWPALAERVLPGGRVPLAGERVKNPPLADLLATVAREGGQAFYRGTIARAIVKTVREAGGCLTEADLAEYAPVERTPVRAAYAGHDVWSMPPPSSGGAVQIEILNILGALPGWPDKDPAVYHHRLVEAMKHAFADRAQHFGDPDFVKVPVGTLTSPTYAKSLAARIGERALPLERYGVRQLPADRGTSHLCVIDADGNAVGMTLTINTTFGSKVVVPGLGLVLNNEMDDFASAPGVPNAFGLVQGEANAVAPHKRPLSSMSPTIFVKDGRVAMVVGASGGPRIITGTLQVALNVLHRGMDAGQAVRAARVHHQWRPDRVTAEPELGPAVIADLERRGHHVARGHAGSAVQVIVARPGGLDAASDPRKGGRPAGPARAYTSGRGKR
jgi:gamma-glutamyltranspeptidase/glutathione hydrolase